MAGRRNTAKRALPASFSQKSTKSGGGKTVKTSNLSTTKTTTKSTGAVRGIRPGDDSLPVALGKFNLQGKKKK